MQNRNLDLNVIIILFQVVKPSIIQMKFFTSTPIYFSFMKLQAVK